MDFASIILFSAAGLSLTSASCWNNSARLHIAQLNPSFPTSKGEFHAEEVLTGPLYQMRDYNECIHKLEAQYCLTEIQLSAADNSSQLWQTIQESNDVPSNLRRDKLLVGICVPKQCSNSEIINAFQESVSAAAQNLGITATVNVDEQDCQTKHRRPLTTLDVTVGFVFLCIILLVICGSRYDAITRLQKREKQVQSTGGRLLLCFSLFKNVHKLGNRSKADNSEAFQLIETLRFCLAVTMLAAHSIEWKVRGPIQNTEWLEETFTNFFWNCKKNFHAWLGAYLTISGFLTSYFFIRDRHVKGSFSMSDFLKTILRRYVRLTPAYAVMVALMASWSSHIGNGPMWNRLVDIRAENCRQNWWINLLYLNNYINFNTICLLHTWYLATDFQCYITSILVLVLIWKYPRFDKMILGAVMVLWIVVPFLQTYVEILDPTIIAYPDTIIHMTQDKTFRRMYVTLQGNAGAYIVGVIFGYIYYYTRQTGVKKTRLRHLAFWSISFTFPWIFPIIGSFFYQPSYNVLSASLFACAFRTVTGVGTAVFVTGFGLGYGRILSTIVTWRPFQILGQLSYTIYLTHYCLLNFKAGAMKQPNYISSYLLYQDAFSDLIISTGLALLLCLSVEMPTLSIMKEFNLLENSKRQTATNDKNLINNGVHQQAATVEKDGTNVYLLDRSSTNQNTASHLKSS